jgi:hypothetical protein
VGSSDARGVIQVACDESGFVGGSLFGRSRVFAHASLHVDPVEAAELTDEVRRRTEAGGQELKASRLNRSWARPIATWLCAADGPLADRVVVHVTDTRLFGLARLAQVVMSDASPDGWWDAHEDDAAWEQALSFDAVLAGLPPRAERELLLAARDLLWVRRRRRLGDTTSTWAHAVESVAGRMPDGEARRFLRSWAAPDAVARADAYLAVPPASPLSEPLLPALRWAVRHWSAKGDVDVVHDEQSVLTAGRVAAIAEELASAYPGRRMAGFARVDSRDDPRVQLADLVAGVVRRSLEGRLSGEVVAPGVPVDHLVAADSILIPPVSDQSASRKNTSQPVISSGTS